MAPKTPLDSSKRRELILNAATHLFANKGLKETTNKDIAEAAGITAAALYWYFPSKDELFAAVLEQKKGNVATFKGLLEAAMDAPPQLVLKNIATYYLTTFTAPENKDFLRLMLAEMMRRPEAQQFFHKHVLGVAISFLGRYFARQVELERLRPVDIEVAVQQFLGALVSMVMRNIMQDGWLEKVGIERVASQAVYVFLDGLRAHPEKE